MKFHIWCEIDPLSSPIEWQRLTTKPLTEGQVRKWLAGMEKDPALYGRRIIIKARKRDRGRAWSASQWEFEYNQYA